MVKAALHGKAGMDLRFCEHPVEHSPELQGVPRAVSCGIGEVAGPCTVRWSDRHAAQSTSLVRSVQLLFLFSPDRLRFDRMMSWLLLPRRPVAATCSLQVDWDDSYPSPGGDDMLEKLRRNFSSTLNPLGDQVSPAVESG